MIDESERVTARESVSKHSCIHYAEEESEKPKDEGNTGTNTPKGMK